MSHGFALCSDEYRDLCASVEQKEAQLAAAEKRCAEMEKQIAELKPLAAPVWPGPERGQGGDDEQQ